MQLSNLNLINNIKKEIKSNKNKNRKFKIIYSIFRVKKIYKYSFLFFFLLSYFLFYLSLEKCFDGWDECCIKIRWIKLKLIEALLSNLILSILIELIILNKLSKYNFIHILFAFLIFYYYSHGKDFHDHGYYNLIGSLLIIILIFIGLIPFNLLKCIKKNNYYIYLYIISLSIILYSMNHIFKKNWLICDDWSKGLNNSFIENNKTKYGCQIAFPKICPYKIGKIFLDFTKLNRIRCNNRNKNAIKTILTISKSPYINKNSKRIGYPLINKETIYMLDFNERNNILYEYFLNNLIDMDNKDLLNNLSIRKFPEIEIDFTNNNQGVMNINLTFNSTLSEERKLKEKYANSYSNNIMVLYIDSVSRANSISFKTIKKNFKIFWKIYVL